MPNGLGGHFVAGARDSGGLINLRRQIVGYHYPAEEQGKPAGLMRPRKIDDDLIDPLRAFAVHRFPAQPTLSEAEQRERKLPERLRQVTIQELPPAEQGRANGAQQLWLARCRSSKTCAISPPLWSALLRFVSHASGVKVSSANIPNP